MSVQYNDKCLIITDCLNGKVLDTIRLCNYSTDLIDKMLHELINNYVWYNEHGIMIKISTF